MKNTKIKCIFLVLSTFAIGVFTGAYVGIKFATDFVVTESLNGSVLHESNGLGDSIKVLRHLQDGEKQQARIYLEKVAVSKIVSLNVILEHLEDEPSTNLYDTTIENVENSVNSFSAYKSKYPMKEAYDGIGDIKIPVVK